MSFSGVYFINLPIFCNANVSSLSASVVKSAMLTVFDFVTLSYIFSYMLPFSH